MKKPSPAARPKRPPTRKLDFSRLPWRKVAGVAVVLAIAAALVFRHIDIEALHASADRLPGIVAFALLTLLPLVGFPASILHVAAGIRFGQGLGLALVALSILLQLLASYALVHLFRERFTRWLAPVRKKIPSGAHASVCVLAVLLPGAPFTAINYVLPLLGVPLRTYLLCCLPLHVLRSTVTVTFGGQSDHLTPGRLAALVAYALLILGASAWTYRRVRSQLESPPPAAGGRRQPA